MFLEHWYRQNILSSIRQHQKASKLTFFCFQILLTTMQGLNNWSWKQTNASFEAFLVWNQGWRIKGQMLRYLILYPKNIFRFLLFVHVHLKTDNVDYLKKPSWKSFFCIILQSTHQIVEPQILPKNKQTDLFIRFLGESAAPQFGFEIYWPLDTKKVFECWKDFFAYFNALETYSVCALWI